MHGTKKLYANIEILKCHLQMNVNLLKEYTQRENETIDFQYEWDFFTSFYLLYWKLSFLFSNLFFDTPNNKKEWDSMSNRK